MRGEVEWAMGRRGMMPAETAMYWTRLLLLIGPASSIERAGGPRPITSIKVPSRGNMRCWVQTGPEDNSL